MSVRLGRAGMVLAVIVAPGAAGAGQTPPLPASATSAVADAVVDTVDVPTRDGGTLTAIVARPREGAARLPAVLRFTIYARPRNLTNALEGAARGYVGIVATTRGKRRSAGPVVPYERDGADAYDLIDWISRQPWSDGRVGMIGGSYDAFTQWASTKRLHPALRTIVTSASVAPGVDVPMENNVYQSFVYSWVPYVTNNNLLDSVTYGDRQRWWRLDSTWFVTGAAYRTRDEIDGTPNPIFRRWLDHPSYDAYWRRMIPYQREFADVTIPVLTTTGYFDGGQIGALYYFREHVRYNRSAEHYLLIGPWDHFGSQGSPSPRIGAYEIDSVARVDITGVIYQWFDHVLRGKARPAILADRVNFEVMGANAWRHVPTLAAVSDDTLTLYLANAPGGVGTYRALRAKAAPDAGDAALEVDLANRVVVSNVFIRPWPDSLLDTDNSMAFVGEPLAEPVTMSGSFVGQLEATVNAKDVDVAVVLYELTARGEYLQLSYFLGRASYARDPTTRRLLRPGERESIPFWNTRMTSRRLGRGSRLVVVVTIPKGPGAQINYGTGKDVSDETIADARAPRVLRLRGDSWVKVPILRR